MKTNPRMHYHGADGVYASVTDTGMLKLYWGKSKIYKSAAAAIRDCLASIAPFLLEPEHEGAERERDLILLSDKAEPRPTFNGGAQTLFRQKLDDVQPRTILRDRPDRV